MPKIIKQLECLRCGYKWYPNSPNPPKYCANKKCRSPYWDKPRRAVKRKENDIMPPEKFRPPSKDELELQALNFYKTYKREEYQRLKNAGELETLCHLKAENAMRFAQDSIAIGMSDNEAWNKAIRSEILESETDTKGEANNE